MDLNRVVLQGMVGTDLELRKTTTSKKAVTSFRVATTAHFKDEEGTIIESTPMAQCCRVGRYGRTGRGELAERLTGLHRRFPSGL